MRSNEVEKLDESRQIKTGQKASEVKERGSPMTNPAKRLIGQQKSPKVLRTTTAINNRFESKSSGEE